jgi:HAE1 family hydrophobic/amphiphilic exporter-1
VTASTLTTVAVFFPLVFVEGVAGQLFGDLALTVIFSLAASLLVALFLLPMLYVYLGERDGPAGRAPPAAGRLAAHTRAEWAAWRAMGREMARGPAWGAALRFPYRLLRWGVALGGLVLTTVFRAALLGFVRLRSLLAGASGTPPARLLARGAGRFGEGVERFTGAYGRWLERAVDHPGRVLAAALAVLAVSLLWGLRLEQELIPPLHQGVLRLRVEAPPGTPLETTSEWVGRIERAIPRRIPGAATFARIGEEPEAQSVERGGENVGLVWIRLAAEDDLAREEAAAAALIREIMQGFPDLAYRLRPPPLFTLKPPVAVEVQGAQLDALAEAARDVERILRGLPELTEVRSALREGSPEIQLLFNRERLARQGLTARAVAELVRDKLEGETSLQFRTLEKKVDVRVRVRRPQLDSLQKLAALTINPGQPVPIPLSAVAELREGRGPGEIHRVSQHRAALVTAALADGDLKGALASVERALRGAPLPGGVRLVFAGQSGEMTRSLRSLFFALSLAIFLVYLVMASQFESVVQPLVIMLSVPLAGIGVVWVLWATGQTLDVLVGIGLIVLVGIVVNNAIVLVNTINRLRRAGAEPLQAILEGARIRLRPILMTTATTVLGLLPMVLDNGAGVEIRRPIALTLIAGLVVSMALTLVVIPCAVRGVERLAGRERAAAP